LSTEEELAKESIRTFTYLLLVCGIVFTILSIALGVLRYFVNIKLPELFINIPMTLGLTLLSASIIGLLLERRAWLKIITDRITSLMINPEFLSKIGMKTEKIRENVIGLLRGGLSIEALDECFFENLDEVVISTLLEPIREEDIHSFDLKIDEKDGKKIVIINHYHKFKVINPTNEPKSLLPYDIVAQVVSSPLQVFPNMDEEEIPTTYKLNFIKVDGNDVTENVIVESPEQDKYGIWRLTKKYEETIMPHSSDEPEKSHKIVEIDMTLIADTADFIACGIKCLTRNLTCVVTYPDELDVFLGVTPPTPYPIMKTHDKETKNEKLIWYDKILYPGNSIIVTWKPKIGE